MNECELKVIEEISKGNTDAYESIIDKYDKKIYGYIFSLVRNSHTAEELTQETFIKIYRNLDKFDRDKELSVWMFRIARNTVLDYLRKTSKHKVLELNENIAVACDDDSLSNPADIIERKEKITIVEAIIDALPRKYKELVILKYFEGLSYIEISSRLGIPQDKVKWSLHQARKKMASEFERYEIIGEGSNAYGL